MAAIHFDAIFLQERAEWINSILQQLWFNVGNYTRKIITESVEPSVSCGSKSFYEIIMC